MGEAGEAGLLDLSAMLRPRGCGVNGVNCWDALAAALETGQVCIHVELLQISRG